MGCIGTVATMQKGVKNYKKKKIIVPVGVDDISFVLGPNSKVQLCLDAAKTT